MLGHKVRAGQEAVAFQREHCGGDEALADAGREHRRIGCHGAVGLYIRKAGRGGEYLTVRQRNRGGRTRKPVARAEFGKQILKGAVLRDGGRAEDGTPGNSHGDVCRLHVSMYHDRASPGMTSVTAPSRVNIVSRFHHTTTAATTTRIHVSLGCASGQNGLMSCQWNIIGITRLPRVALKIGVTRMASTMLPTKKGRKLHSAKTTPAR